MTDKSGGAKRTVPYWKRPIGPINVWRIIEAEEKLNNGQTKRVRISIQDVPEDRYNEGVEHMLEYFLADEVTCKCLKVKEDKAAVEDFRELWKYLLEKGMCIGAYKLGTSDELLELVGINITFVTSDELDEALKNFTINFKSLNARRIFEFMGALSENVDVNQIYDTDKYISALGLSVKPELRGQKLGLRLLEARDDLGRKFNITATSTIFTAVASQIQAERAGFETAYTKNYSEVFDENGKLLFPGIQAKCVKIMNKRIV